MRIETILVHPRLVLAVAGALLLASLRPADALALPTESLPAVSSSVSREAHLAQIARVLERPEAQWHLRLSGLTGDDVQAALLTLNDDELAAVAKSAERVRVAGDAILVIGISLGTILLAALVACIIYLIVKADQRGRL